MHQIHVLPIKQRVEACLRKHLETGQNYPKEPDAQMRKVTVMALKWQVKCRGFDSHHPLQISILLQ